MKILPRLFAFLGLSALSGTLLAQAGGVLVMESADGFFVSIVAGILLALAFHFLLSNLGVALGISAIGDLRKKGKKKKGHSDSSHSKKDADSSSTASKITSGVGITMTLAMSIALFCASLIAVSLSLVPSVSTGLQLGLVIWAGYLLVALYIDAKLLNSLTGSVVSAIRHALGYGAMTAQKMMAPSKHAQLQETIQDAVKTFHDEVRQEFDLSGLERKLDEYVRQLEPQHIDMSRIHEHLADLLREMEIKEVYSPEDPDETRRLFIEIAEKHKRFSDREKQQLSSAFDKAKESVRGEGSRLDKATRLTDKMSPGSEEQAREYRKKVEQYLRDTGREELNPDTLKQDLERILDDPKAAPDIISARVSQLDRSTLEAALATRQGISEEQAKRYLDRGEEILEEIRRRANQASQKTGEMADSARHRAQDAQVQGQGRRSKEERKAAAENAIAQWFDRMERPELQYSVLKSDARHMMDDPKSIPSVLRNRLRKMDRESIVALVSNNPRISHEQAERVADQIEAAREETLRKADQIETQIKEKAEQAKTATLKQAETARQTAADAAWWLFVATGVSAIASGVGGMLAGIG